MKERQSNIELLRLVSMMLLVMLHANFYSNGGLYKADILAAPGASALRIFWEEMCNVCVNVFVLISGWFAIKPSIKGVASLLFQILFLGALIPLMSLPFGVDVSIKDLIPVFFFGSHYWFIPAYLILYGISPVLNKFIEHVTKKEYLFVLIGFFVLETLFGFISHAGRYMYGFHALSFIGLYLLARYVRIHSTRWINFSFTKDIVIFLVCTLITTVIYLVGRLISNQIYHVMHYCAPLMILAALFLLLAFAKLQIQSKIINWLAGSALAIYLIHMHPMVEPYFKLFMQQHFAMLGSVAYIVFMLVAAVVIGLVCILLDKIRVAAWCGMCKLCLNNWFEKFNNWMENVKVD